MRFQSVTDHSITIVVFDSATIGNDHCAIDSYMLAK